VMNVKGMRRSCAILEGTFMTSVWRKLGVLQKISGYLVSYPRIKMDTSQIQIRCYLNQLSQWYVIKDTVLTWFFCNIM
jgi:hypothetical protein